MSVQHSFDLGDGGPKESQMSNGEGHLQPLATGDHEQVLDIRPPSTVPEDVSLSAPPEKESHDPRVPLTQEVVGAIFGPANERSFAVRYWDGTFEPAGKTSTPDVTIAFQRPGALRRMLLPPSELSIVEAFLSGDVDIEGKIEAAIHLGDEIGSRLQSPAQFAGLLRKLMALPNDPSTAPKEVKGTRFSRGLERLTRRPGDEKAIQYHYDVGNDFYQLWLDPRMVYTCAYFQRPDQSLADAQVAKLDHICRKLRLEPGMRMLDVGCGWGALIMHAAQNYGVEAVGITLSKAQASLGTQRIAAAGLSDRCRIELRDYRDMGKTPEYDRAASVGMMEHVLPELQVGYFDAVYRVLKPGGLFMNHAIVSLHREDTQPVIERVKARLWKRNAFIQKYVFPEGKLVPIAHVVASAERVGFELRDVESLREHYAMTLRHWTGGLEAHSSEAIKIAGERTYRVWRLYMAGAAHSFAYGGLNLIQALLVKPDAEGRSEMPLTRDYMYADRSPLAISSTTAAA